MPALAFLASVGLVLVAMLFAANAMLPDNGPVIVVSERIGLPESWHPAPDPTSPSTFAPIPAPEMTSQAVISTPVSEAEGHAIKPAARTARAEAAPKKGEASCPAVTRPSAKPRSTEPHSAEQFGRQIFYSGPIGPDLRLTLASCPNLATDEEISY